MVGEELDLATGPEPVPVRHPEEARAFHLGGVLPRAWAMQGAGSGSQRPWSSEAVLRLQEVVGLARSWVLLYPGSIRQTLLGDRAFSE
jgi:hypothetical protein